MTTPMYGQSSIHPTRPYITTEYFRAQPTGLPPDDLVPGISDARQQDAELAKMILKVSSEMNQFCYGAMGGVIYATVDTETLWTRMDRDGGYKIHPPFTPVREVRTFSAGVDQSDMTSFTDLSATTIERDKFTVFAFPFTGVSSAGPLQFGPVIPSRYRAWVQYSYVNGYACTSLTASVAAGATQIQVGDYTGIYAGMQLTLRDVPVGDEILTVTATPTSNLVSVSALANAHDSGKQVDALPEAVLEAATLILTGRLKQRAQTAVKATGGRGKASAEGTAPGEEDFAEGFEKLTSFIMVRSR